jgi:alkylation response protein AidB-like acyl-CoA dehydrogenase
MLEIKKILSQYLSKDDMETYDMILDLVDDVSKKEIEPYAREMDRHGVKLENGKVIVHPQVKKIIEVLTKNELFALTVPEKYGGTGFGATLQNTVMERFSRADASTSLYHALQGTAVEMMKKYASEELKEKYFPKIAKGEQLVGLLYSEPNSGSDLGSLRAKAVLEGDNYVVNGNKIWISSAGVVNAYTTLLSTDPSKGSRGLTAFYIEADQPGFVVDRIEEKLGLHASPTGAIAMENVEIPKENVIGEVNKGFSAVLYGLSSSRIGIAAQAVGIADAAYRKAVAYASEREQFKTKITDFQATQFKIAEMATRIHLARNYYVYASRLKENNQDFGMEASLAKAFAGDMSQQVTYEAIQMHGGYGYTVEYDVERYYRDARITSIYEGTNEVQRIVIARSEIPKYAKKDN